MNRRPSSALAATALFACGALALAACSAQADTPDASPATASAAATPAADDVTLTVFAAASLSDVFDVIFDGFEDANPGVDVVANYAGSSDLAAQINEGAPADVFASANEKQMEAIGDNAAGEPVLFASNHLTIAVPTGNPGGITGIADFADPDAVTVVCAPDVPCGDASLSLADKVGITLTPSSEEANVTDVLGKVAAGQADAGLVYITDLARAQDVEQIEVPEAIDIRNLYPAAALESSANPEVAAAFVDYLTGEEAQGLLAAAGFAAP